MRIGSAQMSQTISIGRVMLVAGGMVLHSAASAAPATEDDVDAFDRQARVVDRSLQLAQAEDGTGGRPEQRD